MVQAQGTGAVPVNFPPESFEGRQFVDNNGCVFVRAGFDGATTWVPRVNRQRRQVCDQTPTFGGAAPARTAAAPAPVPVPRPTRSAPSAPVQITLDPPAPTRTPTPAATATSTLRPTAPTGTLRAANPSDAPTLAPRRAATLAVTPVAPRVATTRPAPTRVMRAPASKPAAAPPPRLVRPVPAAPATAPLRVTPQAPARATAGGCGASAVSQQYMGRNGAPVRCGPQTSSHVTVIRRGEAPGPGKNVFYNRKAWEDGRVTLPGNTRIVPRHVYEAADTKPAAIPAGYRPAWQDDRLNPYRAWQTVDGHRATQTIWTNTVPRGLVVEAKRHEIKAPVIAYRATADVPPAGTRIGTRVPVISTKNAAPGARYVEIGAFTSRAKAEAAAARLSSAGLPVRFGKMTKGGQTMTRVMSGPYRSADLQGALARAQTAGYPGAYLR